MARRLVRFGAPLLLLVLGLPLIRSQVFSTNDAFDEVNYHRPIIAKMAADFPAVDIVNYNAAMGPGYHVAMAVVLRVTGAWTAVRAANLALGALLVVLTGHVAWHFARDWTAVLTTLMLAASSYVVSGSVWLTTDNLGLLLAMSSLALLMLDRPSPERSLMSGLTGALAAVVRQIHIWTSAPILVSAIVEAGLQPRRSTVRRLAPAALPIITIGSLVLLWGGLLPPRFVGHHGGWNATAFVFGLALIGIYGLPWLLLMTADVRRTLASRAGAAALVVAGGASIAPSSYSVEAGRWGGWLWEAVRRAPAMFDRSVLLIGLGITGALVIATAARRASERGHAREMWLIGVALVSWMTAQSANFQVWQRYFEPAVLILLSWLIALAPPPLDNGRWLLPLAMAAAVLAATILLVHGDVYGFIRPR